MRRRHDPHHFLEENMNEYHGKVVRFPCILIRMTISPFYSSQLMFRISTRSETQKASWVRRRRTSGASSCRRHRASSPGSERRPAPRRTSASSPPAACARSRSASGPPNPSHCRHVVRTCFPWAKCGSAISWRLVSPCATTVKLLTHARSSSLSPSSTQTCTSSQ